MLKSVLKALLTTKLEIETGTLGPHNIFELWLSPHGDVLRPYNSHG